MMEMRSKNNKKKERKLLKYSQEKSMKFSDHVVFFLLKYLGKKITVIGFEFENLFIFQIFFVNYYIFAGFWYNYNGNMNHIADWNLNHIS